MRMLIYALLEALIMADSNEKALAKGLAVLIPGTLGLTYSTIPKAVTGNAELDVLGLLVDAVSIGLFAVGVKLTSKALSK